MYKLFLVSILLISALGSASLSLAQRKSSRARKANHSTITARLGESLYTVASRANISADELARANGLTLTTRLHKGQRLIIPSEVTAAAPVKPPGEIVGKRIHFTDGGTLDVDDVWKQGDSTWYRLHGTSQSATRSVRSIEDRYKSTANTATPAPVVVNESKKTTGEKVFTWIYFVDGARLRVDDVRQVADGAWYTRDKLAIFLASDRISRIEREQPDDMAPAWKESGWSSGNGTIDQLIRKNAARFNIDPYLVFLVIEQESHFHPRVVSPKGAMGLMQLMPGTARRLGVTRPFDASENIRGGTQYLKQLLTMFNGRVDLALASYNAGEGRVLEYGNRVPPFKETREYVKRISGRYRSNGPKTASPESTPGRRQ
jgi:LysM repeat protein